MRRFHALPAALAVLVLGCDRPATAPFHLDRGLGVSASTSLAPDQQAVLTQIAVQIQGWVAAGILNQGQGTALLAKLQTAQAQLAAGTNAGANALNAFINQVSAFSQSGVLSPSQAALLSGLAASVLGNELLFTSIATGDAHSCGLAIGGYAYCWGRGVEGQLGNGATADSPRPVLVSTAQSYVWIGTGSLHTCALTAAGRAECWGSNIGGQLGDGSTIDRLVPTPVSGGLTFASIGISPYGACGLTAAGAGWCWGPGGRLSVDFGGLAAPATSTCIGVYAQPWPCSTIPLQMTGGLTFGSVDGGAWSGCGLTTASTAYCWGWNLHHQLGDGTFINAASPTPVGGGLAFTSLRTGAIHSCGLVGAGSAYCWGGRFFNFGMLGNGTTLPAPTPVAVSGGLTFRSIKPSKGNDIFVFTCGLTTSDDAFCWGANTHGQLGTATTQTCDAGVAGTPCSTIPLPVSGGLTFSEINTGAEFACGVTPGGAGYCWGRNFSGQLGNGTTTNASVPVRVIR